MTKNKILFTLYCLFLVVTVQAQQKTGGSIASDKGIKFFNGTFQQALDEAQKQRKSLFVDFYAVWCGPCKKMAKTIFTQDSVGNYFNEKFINLQLDAEKPENIEIAKQYKAEAFPTLAFIGNDGTALSINVGAMSANELLETARIAVGEAIGFKELYENYKKDPKNLEIQQSLLLQAPRFLSAQQQGMEAEKWLVRVKKLYRSYIQEKMGPALINRQDYILISRLGKEEEDKAKMVNFINANLPAWKEAIGNAAAYYVIEYNDDKISKLAKDGDLKYKEYIEKIKGEYKEAYSIIEYSGNHTPYEIASGNADAIYGIYKNKEVATYIAQMNKYFESLGDNITSNDYGKAAQELYYAAGNKMPPDDYKVAISWLEKALENTTNIMNRINYLVMIGDSHTQMKDYEDAKKYYNQGYLESLQMEKAEMAQKMVQNTIMRKIATLELLKKE